MIGVILSVPVALLAAAGLIATPWVNQFVQTGPGFIRAVPDFTRGLVFVVVVGFGRFAGMRAIVIDTIGFLRTHIRARQGGTRQGPNSNFCAKT